MLTSPCGEPTPENADQFQTIQDDQHRIDWFNNVVRSYVSGHRQSVTLGDFDALVCNGSQRRTVIDGHAIPAGPITRSAMGALVTWQWIAEQAHHAPG